MNRGVAATLSVTLFLAGSWCLGAWHGAATRSHPPAVSIELDNTATPPEAAAGWSTLPVPLLDDPIPDARRDLYGNDITDAVATYKSDRTGSTYEEHSPHTEVPRLTPPKT